MNGTDDPTRPDEPIRDAFHALAPEIPPHGWDAIAHKVRRRQIVQLGAIAAIALALGGGIAALATGGNDRGVRPAGPTTTALSAGERVVAMHSVSANELWVVTETSVLRTENAGRTWATIADIPDAAEHVVAAFRADNDTVRSATAAGTSSTRDAGDVSLAAIAWLTDGSVRSLVINPSGESHANAVVDRGPEQPWLDEPGVERLELGAHPGSFTLLVRPRCKSVCAAHLFTLRDGERRWNVQPPWAISDVRCVSDGTCWAADTETTDGEAAAGTPRTAVIVRSVDGGRFFEPIDLPIPAAVEFSNSARVVFAQGQDFVVQVGQPTATGVDISFLVSRDGGRTFDTMHAPQPADGAAISVVTGTTRPGDRPVIAAGESIVTWLDARTVIIVTPGGLARSIDTGEGWTTDFELPTDDVSATTWLSATNGWLAGDGALWHTTDGGQTWARVALPTP